MAPRGVELAVDVGLDQAVVRRAVGADQVERLAELHREAGEGEAGGAVVRLECADGHHRRRGGLSALLPWNSNAPMSK